MCAFKPYPSMQTPTAQKPFLILKNQAGPLTRNGVQGASAPWTLSPADRDTGKGWPSSRSKTQPSELWKGYTPDATALRIKEPKNQRCSRVFAISQDVCACINVLIFFDRRFRLDWPDRRQVGMCLAGALSLPDTQKSPSPGGIKGRLVPPLPLRPGGCSRLRRPRPPQEASAHPQSLRSLRAVPREASWPGHWSWLPMVARSRLEGP